MSEPHVYTVTSITYTARRHRMRSVIGDYPQWVLGCLGARDGLTPKPGGGYPLTGYGPFKPATKASDFEAVRKDAGPDPRVDGYSL